MDRREFISGVLACGVVPSGSVAAAEFARANPKPEYHAFSRVFQFMKDPYKVAEFLRSCGYDGVEWTVRPDGFLPPDQVTVASMKRLRDAAAKGGIKADNIVVNFLRGDDPGAAEVAMAAKEAGFVSFRGGYFRYDRAKTHRQNMDVFRSGFDSLEILARRSGLRACYQNHSTYNKKIPLLGSLVWDLYEVVKDHDPEYIGIQYDPMHVRAEGGPSWDHTLGAVAPWIDIVCLKDFHYSLDATGKDWKRELVPAGKGIVDFAEVKRLMDLESVKPRYTVHYDYDFPSAEAEARLFAESDLKCYRRILDGFNA